MPWTKTFNNRTEFDKALKDAPGLRRDLQKSMGSDISPLDR
jgi:hypothetical protein